MATLFKRKGSTKFWIKIHRPGQGSGKSDHIPTGTADPKTAQAILDGLKGDVARGVPVNIKASTLEFWVLTEDVMTDYENEGYKSIKMAHGRFVNHIVPFFGSMIAANITAVEIRKYKQLRLKQKAKPATIRHELELVKRAFTLGRAYKIQPLMFELGEVKNARQGFFEQADFERVMAVIDGDYRGFLLFAYITGWRTGEIKNLRRRHLDFVNRVIRLDPGTTKNGDGRVFPMIGGLEAMLSQQVAGPGFSDDYVFTYELRGQRRPIGDFGKAFNTACYKAGIPCVTEPWSYTDRWGNEHHGVRVLRASRIPHDFRRTAVRNLSRMGTSPQVAMQMCGHRTQEVFTRYRIVDQGDLDTAAAKMESAYADLLTRIGVGTVVGTVRGIGNRK